VSYKRRPLTREQVCKRAGAILAQLDTKRGPDDGVAFLSAWGKMWDLMEEARRAGLPFQAETTQSWSYSEGGDGSTGVTRRRLTSGEFEIPVPPPNNVQLAADLPEFLNWACVPQPRRE
jgi:hypothetical protein